VSEEGILLADEAPITELDELRPLIAEGQERGFLTFGQIEACLEEVEVTKEQLQELHSYLEEQGIDVVVGTPGQVADAIEAWFEATDVDGLNMPFAVSPGDFEDIADMLVPELTKRGRYKNAYAEGTLREKLFGTGRARLAAPHPAAQYRPQVRARAAE